MCLFMASVLATPALAQEKIRYTEAKKIEILQATAYIFITDSNDPGYCDSIGGNYSKQLLDTYLKMSDDEFEEAIKSNLKDVENKIGKGSSILWSKDFVENTIKSEFSEMYADIAQQVKQQEKQHEEVLSSSHWCSVKSQMNQ